MCACGRGIIFAETSPKLEDVNAVLSKEAFVIEQDSTTVAFENDGTNTRESTGRIRIQSDAGLQRYGVVQFSYQNSNQSLDIAYVRVRKPDGSIITSPADNIQDMVAAITREAPVYTDLREKHVAVKGLSVGDILEYQARWHTTKPEVPGQFWFMYNFSHDSIILEEKLQISVPAQRPVKWNGGSPKPNVVEKSGRRIFTWTTSQLQHKSSEQEKTEQETNTYRALRGQLPSPEVQLSSFDNWEEIGRWYGDLQKERVTATPEIRSKAEELTRNAKDEDPKLRAIYSYVSTQFRYIGIAFGTGRYQPHSAAEVLSNQYGDCKDKHTLLASLLGAVGISAYPALISSSHEIDSDVPSPAQFDHVITAVRRGTDFL